MRDESRGPTLHSGSRRIEGGGREGEETCEYGGGGGVKGRGESEGEGVSDWELKEEGGVGEGVLG